MNTQIIVTIILSVLASSGLWQFIIFKSQAKSTQTLAILALLHNEIYRISEEAIKRGSITSDELDNLTTLYEPYRKLGGNGTGEALYTKAKNLLNVEKEK